MEKFLKKLAKDREFWCREVLDFFEIPYHQHGEYLLSRDAVLWKGFDSIYGAERRASYLEVAETGNSEHNEDNKLGVSVSSESSSGAKHGEKLG